MKIKSKISQGFTIVELFAVIVIIGILATITIVSYNGIQSKARDTSVLSDIDTMDALQTSYGLKNSTSGLAYYSGSGISTSLGFTPSNGNVIDVVTNATDYCIRGYNPNATKYSIVDSFTKESSAGVCDLLNPSDQAIADSSPNAIKQIAVSGHGHTCGIAYFNKKAYCWGDRNDLGIQSTGVDSPVPVAVSTAGVLGSKTIKSISTSLQNTCVIASDDKAYCWGDSLYLGDNTSTISRIPVAVYTGGYLNNKTIKSVVIGMVGGCVLASDNQVYCWGESTVGNLGNGSTTTSLVPTPIDMSGVLSGMTIKSVVSRSSGFCAIASDDKVYCWGYGWRGQLGNGATTDALTPVPVSTSGVLSGKTIKSISATGYIVCAMDSDNNTYCWGSNYAGQLGNNVVSDNSPVPVAVYMGGELSGKKFKSISTGSSGSCAITTEGKAYCWGGNTYGRVGDGTSTDRNHPVAVDTSGVLNGKTIKSISTESNHTCAIASDNKAYCWGRNDVGQLGNNTKVNSQVPVLVSPLP